MLGPFGETEQGHTSSWFKSDAKLIQSITLQALLSSEVIKMVFDDYLIGNANATYIYAL